MLVCNSRCRRRRGGGGWLVQGCVIRWVVVVVEPVVPLEGPRRVKCAMQSAWRRTRVPRWFDKHKLCAMCNCSRNVFYCSNYLHVLVFSHCYPHNTSLLPPLPRYLSQSKLWVRNGKLLYRPHPVNGANRFVVNVFISSVTAFSPRIGIYSPLSSNLYVVLNRGLNHIAFLIFESIRTYITISLSTVNVLCGRFAQNTSLCLSGS